MIPNNQISARTVLTPMAFPNNLKDVGLMDMELGGVAIEDASEGLLDYFWIASANEETGLVSLHRQGQAAIPWWNIGIGCTDLALAFTQNMQPVIAWQDSENVLWLRAYDSFTNSYLVSSFGIGANPRLTIDEKRPRMRTESDVIFAYLVGTSLRYRQQRDAFQIERVLVTDVSPASVFLRMGMGGLQLQFELK